MEEFDGVPSVRHAHPILGKMVSTQMYSGEVRRRGVLSDSLSELSEYFSLSEFVLSVRLKQLKWRITKNPGNQNFLINILPPLNRI
jgi:hypothetical protein